MHVYKGHAAKTLDYITVFFFKSEDYWPENHVEITMKMLNRDPEIKTICSTVQATIILCKLKGTNDPAMT